MAVSLLAAPALPRVPPYELFVPDTAFFSRVVTQMTFCFLVFDIFERVLSLLLEVEQRPSHITPQSVLPFCRQRILVDKGCMLPAFA